MIISFDTSHTSGLDTLNKFIFAYDAQKRVERIYIYEYNPGTPGYEFFNEETRFYSGDDTLPYKVSFRVDDFPSPPDIDTIFLTYRDGVVIKDSTITYTGLSPTTTVLSFTKLTNTRYYVKKRVFDNFSNIRLDSFLCERTWLNGNVVSSTDSLWDMNGGFSVYNYQAEYDNHPNPVLRTVLPYPLINFQHFIGPDHFFPSIRSVNNVTRTVYKESGMGTAFETRYFYQYRADGYPVSDRDDDPIYADKSIYIYTRL